MTSRSIFGVLAVISGFVGLVCGVSEWFLQIMILPEIDWAEPFMSLANLCWLGHIFFFGVGICFAGLAPICAGKSQPAPPPVVAQPAVIPPPVPATRPAQPSPKAESEDLWQAADAPFPKPGKIEHPDEDENLWQAESAPFPKVDIPEEAEAEAKAEEDAPRKD
ncbi:hypothetical protein [Cerasicoccus maritimus]|uniref:hypothetical protein n=1 Tax=Cerasicoccus maritimus TaxID=490089 RepID=UPI002852804B|nr:hypothetical protein [Cerasicoccus maritimus]